MIKEDNVLMRSTDENNDTVFMYPATKKDNIIDLEEASVNEAGLMSSSDKQNLDNMQKAIESLSLYYSIGSDENGIYIECLKNKEE